MIMRKDRSAPTSRLQRIAVRAAVLAFAASLAGCSILGSGPRDGSGTTIYAPGARVAADPSWPAVDWSLSIAPATAPRMLDNTRIAVRPTPGELQVYRNASWSQPPTALVADAVLHALEDSGKIAAVARQGSGIRANYKLELDIRRFEADYAGKDTPDAVIEVSAKLLGTRDQNVVASRTFVQRQPAAGTEIPQVTAAFEQSLQAVSGDITGWTLANGRN